MHQSFSVVSALTPSFLVVPCHCNFACLCLFKVTYLTVHMLVKYILHTYVNAPKYTRR